MSDIYIPGVKSRLNTEGIIQDLMKVERVPRDRAEKQIETLQTEKGYWQEIGRRITTLRESARSLYSFQNPFSERIASSSDESVLTASASRQAVEQERTFTVKQIAKADRFLSDSQDNAYKVPAGTYTFTVGKDEISLNYRGGSLKDFAEMVSRRGRDKLRASVVNVQSGAQSLLVESLVTGAENRLSFSAAAADLAQALGLGKKESPETPETPPLPDRVAVKEEPLTVAAGDKTAIAFDETARDLSGEKGVVLTFETATRVTPPQETAAEEAPPGPSIPGAGSVSYRGITIENDASSVPIPQWEAPPPQALVDDPAMLSLTFTDGTSAALPVVRDSSGFIPQRINLDDFGGKNVASLDLENNNTHRDLTIRNVTVFNPNPPPPKPDFKPSNALSTAQDAVVVMDGVEITRPSNDIEDLIPGVTVTARAPSDTPVSLKVEPNRDAVKESIITMVGNYNRMMAELNVITRNDERIIRELTYMTPEEQKELQKRMGVFSGDAMLNQLKNGLQQAVTAPYPTQAEQELSLLAQIGIGTDVRRSGASAGYDPSRLRGYLEIDEKVLDEALRKNLPAIRDLFGSDTDGDLIVDAGIAYAVEVLSKPYVETGGVVSLKTGTLDSKISQEQRRVATLDRQLAAKEESLKRQYGQMEGAYNRMERMGTSLDNFSRQANSINNNR
ncbi:MAG: flagellar filament capping protein FliD [Treponema sp.]|jgi:flagellar hook-associated protein 2|nr:flagellar filament capping protein FliD [Treponema sp.]